MNYDEKMQCIIDKIEDHLQRVEEPIQMAEIETIAQCSLGFFQKVFSYMYGISLAQYIRNRKMTLAGYDMKSTSLKVIEIALKYGYESPTSFTKAFTNFHKVSPTQARDHACKLRVYPKMQLINSQQYHWNIEHKEAFRLVGKSTKLSTTNQQHARSIPAFWSACQKDATFAHLIAMDEAIPKGLFGLFYAFDEEAQTTSYIIGVISSSNEMQDVVEIPAMTWAIFDCVGRVPEAIQSGWRFLQEEWLVKYPFAHGEAPELEWYSDGNIYDEDYHSQIWIPIKEVI